MLKKDRTDERVKRHEETQEDFTPDRIVDKMINCLGEEVFDDFSKTIIDYSAGTGNLLVPVLKRRLERSSSIDESIKALKTIFGVEVMADNVYECRRRMYEVFIEKYGKTEKDSLIKSIIKDRIRWGDSLDFDYESWSEEIKVCDGIDLKEKKTEKDTRYPLFYKESNAIELF